MAKYTLIRELNLYRLYIFSTPLKISKAHWNPNQLYLSIRFVCNLPNNMTALCPLKIISKSTNSHSPCHLLCTTPKWQLFPFELRFWVLKLNCLRFFKVNLKLESNSNNIKGMSNTRALEYWREGIERERERVSSMLIARMQAMWPHNTKAKQKKGSTQRIFKARKSRPRKAANNQDKE